MNFSMCGTIEKWYGRQTKRQQMLVYFLCFSVIFAITWMAANGILLIQKKSLILQDDSLATYEMMAYHKRIAQEIFGNLTERHKLIIPWVNYNLTGDSNLLCITVHEIFDIFSWLVPQKNFELVYSVVIIMRLWLIGASFSLYCMRRGHRKRYILPGSLIYVFCGYAMFFGNVQPSFMSMLYRAPILFISIEDILDKKSGKLFSIMVFLSWFNCIFTTYYNTVVVGLYFLARCIERGLKFRASVNMAIKTGVYYLIGFGLGGMIFIPQSLLILSSGRIQSGMNISFTYGLSYFIRMIKNLFIVDVSRDYYLGVSVATMLPLLYLFFFSKKKVLKIGLVALVAFMNLPAFGFLAGAGIINNRWSYFLGFVIAYIFVELIPELVSGFSKKKQQQMNFVAFLCVFTLAWLNGKNGIATVKMEVFTVAVMVVMIFCMNIIWRINRIYISIAILTGVIMLSAALNGISIYSARFSSMAQFYAGSGGVNEVLAGYVDAAAQQIVDDSFFRVDKSEFTDELSCNLPFWYGYNGISSFANTLNVNSAEYFRKMENTGMLQANKYADLGGKATDEALAGIKYYLVDKRTTEGAPYGFEWLSDYSENEQYALYVNRYALPLGFTYENAISYRDFDTLSIAQKQEVLLKRVLLEEGITNKDVQTIDLHSRELGLQIVDCYNIEKTDTGWHVVGEDAFITVRVDSPKESELYLRLAGVENRSNANCIITATALNKEETAYSHGISSERSNSQQNFTFNMGNGVNGDVEATISFAPDRDVFVEDIQAYARDLRSYADDINQLTQERLEDVCFETNSINGNISVERGKYLCFSIPYSKGWSCYVDGEKTDILKANIMYMAVWLEAGSHHIELRYIPEGMRFGAAVSFATLFMVVSVFAVKKYRSQKGRETVL